MEDLGHDCAARRISAHLAVIWEMSDGMYSWIREPMDSK